MSSDRSMEVGGISVTIGQRFHRPRAQSLVAKVRSSQIPIIVSHVLSDVPTPEKTLSPPNEAAFAIHVHHRPLTSAETWIDGKHRSVPMVPTSGVCFFDLQSTPVAFIHQPFDFSRFYIARSTLDDLAYNHDMPHLRGLRIPEFGYKDPVIHHLALAVVARFKMFGEETDCLFADWVALAFHSHLVRAYGENAQSRLRRGALAPWRLRFVSEWMTERLAGPMSISEIANQIDMAPGHFAKAFRESTGVPPHRWLTLRRLDQAKDLMRKHDMTLAEIAVACGFVDQSHFTRVFAKLEGTPPGQWRENLRR